MNIRRTSIALLLTSIGVAAASLEGCSSSSSSDKPCELGRDCFAPCSPDKEVTASADQSCKIARGDIDACGAACGGGSCRVEDAFLAESNNLADASTADVSQPDASSSSPDASADGGVVACPDRPAKITCQYRCLGGRATSGVETHAPAPACAASYFVQMAELEAISVLSFRRLARELEHLGAPSALVATARAAALEEAGHAATMTALAEARGARVEHVPGEPTFAERSLFEIARENAREGCVRETYGAVLAAFAGVRAPDPAVRAAMARVAKEEAGHAQFSWGLHAWAWARLSEDEQATVHLDLLDARKALRESIGASAPWADEVGLPAQAAALGMLNATEAALFAA